MISTLNDRIRGSLIGGAVGDAFGYPVEFMSRDAIVNRFGPNGITEFYGKALISDDTQMTLFTANGLLLGANLTDYVKEAYLEWYSTQVGNVVGSPLCWIRDIRELNVRRAPGNTCMTALANLDSNNNSKGCGGIMRVAPVALVLATEHYSGNVQTIAAYCAAITHKHPMGYICAAVFADIILRVLKYDGTVSRELFIEFVRGACNESFNLFTTLQEQEQCKDLLKQVDNALSLADGNVAEEKAIEILGEGWTGDEALTIALFCAVRHFGNFHAALIAAVNHNGDSDSTGAICGNMMGAMLGLEKIKFPDIHKLELFDLILEIADDISNGGSLDRNKYQPHD